MTEIDEYAFILFLRSYQVRLIMPGGFVRYGDLLGQIRIQLNEILEGVKAIDLVDARLVSEELFFALANHECIIERKDKFAGPYYGYLESCYAAARQNILSGSSINKFASEIGDRFFEDVFTNYRHGELENDGEDDPVTEADAPASDRIVRLDDNQRIAIEAPLDTLICNVEENNGQPDDPGFRERMLG